LLAGSPPPPSKASEEAKPETDNTGSEFSKWFISRLLALLKGDILRRGLPQMMTDIRTTFDAIAAEPRGITDPFESIYKLVFQLTMRTVACREIADDPALLKRTLRLYEDVEHAATPTVIMYPSLPSPGKLKRMWGGAQLYMIFKKIVDERRKTGRKEDDALQFLIDQGDDIKSIITVS